MAQTKTEPAGPEEQHRTLKELMDRYASEHAARRANHRRELTSIKNLKTFFRNPTLDHITPKLIVASKNQRYTCGVKLATINRELAILKKAFNLACREWEWCTDKPVCRVSMERENNTRCRWLTVEEKQRLLPAAAPWLPELIGGFKFQVQRVNDGAVAHRLPGVSQS